MITHRRPPLWFLSNHVPIHFRHLWRQRCHLTPPTAATEDFICSMSEDSNLKVHFHAQILCSTSVCLQLCFRFTRRSNTLHRTSRNLAPNCFEIGRWRIEKMVADDWPSCRRADQVLTRSGSVRLILGCSGVLRGN